MHFSNQNQLKKQKLFCIPYRIDPREKINAFYSSIITSAIRSNEDMQNMLEIISEADMLVWKNYQNTKLAITSLS